MFGSKTQDISNSSLPSPNGPSPAPSSKESPTIGEFSLGKRGILVFFTLSVLTLMVALDGTSISVALPVRIFRVKCMGSDLFMQDYLERPQWVSHRGILERHRVSTVLDR